jgi:hypothetical protein
MALFYLGIMAIIRTGYEPYHVENLMRRLSLGIVSQYNSAANP